MRNPYLNALAASAYIAAVGTFLHYMERAHANEPDQWYAGIAFISLLTLSVAVMGYLFAGKPLQMYIDGEKSLAVEFFLKTLAAFAVITVALLTLVSLRP